jgi:hypothetical protein
MPISADPYRRPVTKRRCALPLERYRDSEALIEHAAHLGDLTEAILATGSVSGELLGEPSAELRAKLADSEVRLFTPFLSM